MPGNISDPAMASVRHHHHNDLAVGDGGAPNLQKLVQHYGGYHRIPGAEWTKYDAGLATCWQRLRRLHEPVGKFPGTRAGAPTTSRLWLPHGHNGED